MKNWVFWGLFFGMVFFGACGGGGGGSSSLVSDDAGAENGFALDLLSDELVLFKDGISTSVNATWNGTEAYTVVWESSSPNVVAVSENGRAVFLELGVVGTATIDVNLMDDSELVTGSSFVVRVVGSEDELPDVIDIILNDTSFILSYGESGGSSVTLSAMITPNVLLQRAVDWEIVKGDSVVTLSHSENSSLSVVTAIGEGEATVKVSSQQDRSVSLTAVIRVGQVESVEIEIDSVVLSYGNGIPGEEGVFGSAISRNVSVNVDVSPNGFSQSDVIWSVSDADVITIDATSGVSQVIVSGLSAGTATLNVVSASDSGVSASIGIVVDELLSFEFGESIEFVAAGSLFTSTVGSPDPKGFLYTGVNLESSDYSVVTFNSREEFLGFSSWGIIGVSPGTVTVSATSVVNPSIVVTRSITVDPVLSLTTLNTVIQNDISSVNVIGILTPGAVDLGLIWESSDYDVVTLSSRTSVSGDMVTLIGVATGDATVNVRLESHSRVSQDIEVDVRI